MSGEFRELYGSPFMWQALNDAADIKGEHPVSIALAAMYRALAPVEQGAAWFEASDSGYDEPAMALLANATVIADAARELSDLAAQYSAIAAAVIRKAHNPPEAAGKDENNG